MRGAVAAGGDDATGKFKTRIAGFLDAFYLDPDQASRYRRIEDEPARTGDRRTDALIGAIGEHLCHRWALGTPPLWTERTIRFLDMPWYLGGESRRRFLFTESPSAFRRRFIFTEAEPLRRNSMPRDGRWWHYEEMRTGMGPLPEEIMPASRPRSDVEQ